MSKRRPRIIYGDPADIVEGQWQDLFLKNLKEGNHSTETRTVIETITENVKVDDEEYDQLVDEYNELVDEYNELELKAARLESENNILKKEVEDLKNLISSHLSTDNQK